jgi:hypothetical protein
MMVDESTMNRDRCYSPKCLEGRFSEGDIQYPALLHRCVGGAWPITRPVVCCEAQDIAAVNKVSLAA